MDKIGKISNNIIKQMKEMLETSENLSRVLGLGRGSKQFNTEEMTLALRK
jgi:hypothetical protein